MPTRVLVAGATGAIGSELLLMLRDHGHWARAMTRSTARAAALAVDEGIVADALKPESLIEAVDGIDVVVSALGASVGTSMLDRRPYHRVDTPANLNLLAAAKAAGVRRFVYVSVHVEPAYAKTAYVRAHERVVDALRESEIDHSIVRPTGVFEAFKPFIAMARRGPIGVFGDGKAKSNPVHAADVAAVCARHLHDGPAEESVGGPEVMTRNEIARAVFEAIGKRPRLIHIPAWVVRANTLPLYPLNPRLAQLIRFISRATTSDCVAPTTGTRTLREFLTSCVP